MDIAERDEEDDESGASSEEKKRRESFNNVIAVAVALLATFMGICSVKAGNIGQAMQQAQADKIDNYGWYQARNIREEVMRATAFQLRAQAQTAPPAARAVYARQAAAYEKLAAEQEQKKTKQQKDAEAADKQYDALNIHDDQFDLSDALLSVAIALFAVAALTQKRWLFALALAPTFFGVLMGLAGLLGWGMHFAALSNLLS